MTQKTRVPPRLITNIYCLLFSCIEEEERVFLQPSHGGSWAGVSCFPLYEIEIDIDWLMLEFWKIKYWFSPRVFLSPVVGGGSVSQNSPSPDVSGRGCGWWRLITWPRSCLWLVDWAREPRSLGRVSWPGHPATWPGWHFIELGDVDRISMYLHYKYLKYTQS